MCCTAAEKEKRTVFVVHHWIVFVSGGRGRKGAEISSLARYGNAVQRSQGPNTLPPSIQHLPAPNRPVQMKLSTRRRDLSWGADEWAGT